MNIQCGQDTKVEKKEEQDVETVKSSAKAEFLNQKLEEAKNSQKESTAPWTNATSWQRISVFSVWFQLPPSYHNPIQGYVSSCMIPSTLLGGQRLKLDWHDA